MAKTQARKEMETLRASGVGNKLLMRILLESGKRPSDVDAEMVATIRSKVQLRENKKAKEASRRTSSIKRHTDETRAMTQAKKSGLPTTHHEKTRKQAAKKYAKVAYTERTAERKLAQVAEAEALSRRALAVREGMERRLECEGQEFDLDMGASVLDLQEGVENFVDLAVDSLNGLCSTTFKTVEECLPQPPAETEAYQQVRVTNLDLECIGEDVLRAEFKEDMATNLALTPAEIHIRSVTTENDAIIVAFNIVAATEADTETATTTFEALEESGFVTLPNVAATGSDCKIDPDQAIGSSAETVAGQQVTPVDSSAGATGVAFAAVAVAVAAAFSQQ